MTDTWWRARLDEDGITEYERVLEGPTPLEKAPYARALRRTSTPNSSGFMEFMGAT